MATINSIGSNKPIEISFGGTNAASMTNTNGVIYYDGTRLVTTTVGSAAQVLTSNGAGVAPTFQTPVTGAVTWSVITANQTGAVFNGYIVNGGATVTVSLPTTSAVGDIISVVNINNSTGTQFTQAAGQQIRVNTSASTLGATGSFTSGAVGNSLTLVCRVANTLWVATSVVGNWSAA